MTDLAFDKTLLDVGEELLRGGALLLSVVYGSFISYRNDLQKTELNEERTVTKMWVLSNLIRKLKKVIMHLPIFKRVISRMPLRKSGELPSPSA